MIKESLAIMVSTMMLTAAANAAVVFDVRDGSGNSIPDAVVALNGIENGPGDYKFDPEAHGLRRYTVVREGYDDVGGPWCTIDYRGESIRVEVMMQPKDDVDLSGVFWYNQNIFCKYDAGTLHMSTDYGRTYAHAIDLSQVTKKASDIKTIWVFEDRSLFFATLTQCFYSHDWTTYHESRVYDRDGHPFVPNPGDHNFSRLRYHANRPIIAGKELYVWGNYSTGTSAYNNINIWMTSDKGVTVRSTYRFRSRRSDTDNPVLFTRHMHRVDFCPLDSTFWAQTGDHSRDGVHEQHWLLGRYDVSTDTLRWEHLRSEKHAASGARFKSENIFWHDGYLYWSCDTGGYRGGVFRVPYVPGPGNIDQIVDPAQHEHLLATENDCTALWMNGRGEMVAFQNMWGGSGHPHVFHYSPDKGDTWHAIEGPIIHPTGPLTEYWFEGHYGGFIVGENRERLLVRPANRHGYTSEFIDIARFVRNIGFFNALRP